MWHRPVILLVIFLFPVTWAAAEDRFLAGWASASITPDQPVALEGQVRTRVSTHVQDPVTATALAMERKPETGAVESAILISCDLVAIRTGILEGLRERLASRLSGFDVRKVFLHATHTHTAPAMTPGLYDIPEGVMQPADYIEFLVGRLADCAEQAWKSRKPAGVSWALGHAVVGHNRRAVYKGGDARMYGKTDLPGFSHVEGYEDHSVDLLFFWDHDAKLTGVGINVSCPSQSVEGASYVSADFWHDVRVELRKRYSKDLFVYPMTGASGDQSPHLLLHKRAEQKNLERRGLAARQETARRIVSAVTDAFEIANRDIRFNPPFVHKVEDLRLPVRKVSAAEAENARQEMERTARDAAADRTYVLYRNKGVLERYERQDREPFYAMELHVLRLGDVAIATNPFELYLDFGLQIEARSPAEQTFIVQLAGRGMYVPTARALSGGGYGTEAYVSLVGPEGGEVLVERTVETINALWPER